MFRPLAYLCLATLVLGGCAHATVTVPKPATAVVPTGKTVRIAAACARAVAPARGFIAQHPDTRALTGAESNRIRQMVSDAYDVCSARDMDLVRREEIWPWVHGDVPGQQAKL